MVTLRRYQVVPVLPKELSPLPALAHNLWWTWNRDMRALFEQLDPQLFEALSQNPLALLAHISADKLQRAAADPAYLAAVDEQRRALESYLTADRWFQRTYDDAGNLGRIGYFSMEFGVHECLPVYSGGLGVLAGDHLKSASDLGLPLVGVGVAFSLGYFRQSLDEEGWQTERYPANDWHDLPVTLVQDASGAAVTVSVALPASADKASKSREVTLQAWRAEVGRVPLVLLDANLERNAPEDRGLTNTLYGGDRAHRIRQEILLGVGGVRMLSAIGMAPTVCHMNEGHSAFLALERVRQSMSEQGASFDVAALAASAGNVFTTHTPVPAGNDAFAHDLIKPYLELLAQGLGKTAEEVMAIGRVQADKPGGEFSMPVLAIRMADRYNGVSVLHGREARHMWSVLWPGLPLDEVPIGSVTNGVHLGTWVAAELAELYTTRLGVDWTGDASDPALWARIMSVPDHELWAVHERCRARMVQELRARIRATAERRGRAAEASTADGLLDPRALTIGFARRFATYKRGTLLLRDRERLARIVSRADRPVQLVFSGKAHPQDFGGKELIQAIVRASRQAPFRGHILFVEDYDMGVARALVSGVDVWLNTPRRPLEASGTSGMKAALNGGLHASVLDGWWAEAYAGDNGFAIGRGEEYADTEYGDRVEAQALYRLLEDELIPLFYDRAEDGLPHGWIARMKRSIQSIGPVFNTARMVREYVDRAYVPAARRVRAVTDEGLSRARQLVSWKQRVAAAWSHVRVEHVGPVGGEHGSAQVPAGSELTVVADVHLGALSAGDVAVDVYHGRLHGAHALASGTSVPMRCTGELGGGRYRFEATLPTGECGEHAYAVRVTPYQESLADRFSTRLIAWH
jgi:starch phosphorylase